MRFGEGSHQEKEANMNLWGGDFGASQHTVVTRTFECIGGTDVL